MNKIKKFFKKGNGELLGFVACMPVFIFLLVMIVSMTQVALAKESLEYVSYTAARSAVVADGELQDASGNPINSADSSSYPYHAIVNATSICRTYAENNGYEFYKVEILIDGNVVGEGKNYYMDSQGPHSISEDIHMNPNVAWSKGVYITVKTTFYVDAMMDFMDSERSSSIVMMVERPAGVLGSGSP